MRSNDEKTIIRYLLGELEETELGQVEERVFTDEAFLDEVQALERSLIDDYAQGRLDGPEREQFETRFISSPTRRRKVELAKSFYRYISEVAEKPAPVAIPWWKSLLEFLGFARPAAASMERVGYGWGSRAMRLALSSATLVLIGFSYLLYETVSLRSKPTDSGSSPNVGRQRAPGDQMARELEEPKRLIPQPPSDIERLNAPDPIVSGSRADQTIILASPVGTYVEDPEPLLRWEAIERSSAYQIEVVDPIGKSIAGSATETQWKVSEPLQRGRDYIWRVKAMKGDQEIAASRGGRFKILDQSKYAELETARTEYNDSPLKLAIVYIRMGLLDDAEGQLDLVLASRQQSQDVEALARTLIDNLKKLRAPNHPEGQPR